MALAQRDAGREPAQTHEAPPQPDVDAARRCPVGLVPAKDPSLREFLARHEIDGLLPDVLAAAQGYAAYVMMIDKKKGETLRAKVAALRAKHKS